MAEKQKDDTSSMTSLTTSRVIKNPLLSASVTGLTLDDFPNKPLLLPAAPPPLPSAQLRTADAITNARLTNREVKALVIVGETSAIDSETLREVNLNSTADDSVAAIPPIEASNNGDIGETPNTNTESIISQAASSFSALPSVASTVLSTFSKRIYSGAEQRGDIHPPPPSIYTDTSTNPLSVYDIQPGDRPDLQPIHSHQEATEFSPLTAVPPTYSAAGTYLSTSSSIASEEKESKPEPEAPKFYSLHEVQTLPLVTASPIPACGQNTYRLSARKKVYAPIPGLSQQAGQQTPAAAAVPTTLPIVPQPIPEHSQSSAEALGGPQTANRPPHWQEERKAAGLFSISNLVPSSVLQNISGLVQSAADSIVQTAVKSPPASGGTQPELQQLPPQQPPPPFAYPASINYFAPTAPLDCSTGQSPTNNDGRQSARAETAVTFFSTPLNAQVAEESQKVPSPSFNKPSDGEKSWNQNIAPSTQLASSPSDTIATIPTPLAVGDAWCSPDRGVCIDGSFNSADRTPQHLQAALEVTPSNVSRPPVAPSGPLNYRLKKGTRHYRIAPLDATEPTSPGTNPSQVIFNTFASAIEPPQEAGGIPAVLVPDEEVRGLDAPPPPPRTALTDTPFLTEGLQPREHPSQRPAELFAATVSAPIEIATAPLDIGDGKTQSLLDIQQTIEPAAEQTIINPTIGCPPHIGAPPPLPPPPLELSKDDTNVSSNPYRKQSSQVAARQDTGATPTLANFFAFNANDATSGGVNFFAIPPLQPPPSPPSLPPPAPTVTAVSQPALSLASFFNTSTQTLSAVDHLHLQQQQQPQLQQIQDSLPSIISESEEQSSSNVCLFPPPPLAFESKKDEEEKEEQLLVHSTFAVAPVVGERCDGQPVIKSNSLPSKIKQQQPAETLNLLPNFFNETSKFVSSQNSESTRREQQIASFFDTISNQISVVDNFRSENLVSQQTETKPNSNQRQGQQQEQQQQQQEQQQQEQQQQHLEHKQQPQQQEQQQTNEDQRIQNFFNNPPAAGSDLNYHLIHSGLAVKHLETRSLTPVSNLVEPPSSTCSEFSEQSSLGQRPLPSIENISGGKVSGGDPVPSGKQTRSICGDIVNETRSHDGHEADNSPRTKVVVLTQEYLQSLPQEVLDALKMSSKESASNANSDARPSVSYKAATFHWFYKRAANKSIWKPLSQYDSDVLESNLSAGGSNIVAVEGGRYDVNIEERTMIPVYWKSEPATVKRCSWFYKATDASFVPYEERTAKILEDEYKVCHEIDEWHKKVVISPEEYVVFHGATAIVHFQKQPASDTWGGSTQATTRPRVVRRDLDEFTITTGESKRVDHLLLMVHGIGPACDLRMRSVEAVVDDFRSIGRQLVKSHYRSSTEKGLVGRVEVLPISWHSHLHSEEMGIDQKLKSITLESIPKLRNFTNDTLLDVLFYTSPQYCQMIMNSVVESMNAVYEKFCQRHREFNGSVSLAGHSLGSLIIFDLLCHQSTDDMGNKKKLLHSRLELKEPERRAPSSQQVSYTMSTIGTGQPSISYAQLEFKPTNFFALGSPIGMFVTIRGIDNLGLDFCLPTCSRFYNIFHPYDPVAYRIEALINPDMSSISPVLIPHHKGRKRMHLELKETMARLGNDLKQRFFDTFKNTIDNMNLLGSFKVKPEEVKQSLEEEVNSVLDMQMQLDSDNSRLRSDSLSTGISEPDAAILEFPMGELNSSRRVDYVLQEAPFEFFNEYLFALSSHVCYWDSEDTILFVMKEIYNSMGIRADSKVPPQTLTIERPSM